MSSSTADTVVVIGDTRLFGYEVPEKLPFGGAQALQVHKLIGGARIIDAMGADDREIAWSGRFQGPNAIERARHIDFLRKQGQMVPLSWDAFQFNVIIKSFTCDFERFYQGPYQIACAVLEDLTAPIEDVPEPAIDDMVTDDLDGVLALSSLIGIAAVTNGANALAAAIQSAGSLAGAGASVIGSVVTPLAAVQGLVRGLVSSSDAALGGLTATGGVAPGAPLASAASLTLAAAQMTQQVQLLSLGSTLARLQNNLLNAGI